MKRKIFALLLMCASLPSFADATIPQSFPGGLTNVQVYKSTDPLPTPAGWNAPASGQTQPTPPSVVPIIDTFWIYNPYGYIEYYSTFSAAVNAMWPEYHAAGPTVYYTESSYDLSSNNNPAAIEVWFYQYNNPNLYKWSNGGHRWDCPNGYGGYGTYPNAACYLVTPTAVIKPSDGTCHVIKFPDGAWSWDSGGGANGGDPDCTPAWQDAVAAVNDKTRGDACSCDSNTPATPSIPEPANSNR